MLRDDLGLEPGPSLRDLELRILRQEDALLGRTHERRDRCSAGTDGRLHSAAALTKVGAFEEAHAILDTAISEARQGR